ncbi:hypothetical protein B0H63DRAFT_189659 [Podospora didyma]|uniref:Uncharacterized protein n=1 Tax=Podospora didyma TaxID=330526 RepID=A0AAE0U038_9PEZI|nr:hypothetical protein B0H63DRAFT_189659 [Podospora didyma]
MSPKSSRRPKSKVFIFVGPFRLICARQEHEKRMPLEMEKLYRRQHRETRSSGAPSQQFPPPRILSNIHPLYLEENIGGGRGVYASVSVLEPVMRIERTGEQLRHGDPLVKPVYRIILGFTMQVNIHQANGELERHNRIFDSVNVRYLYRSGERHALLPKGDQVSAIQLTHESGRTSDAQAGVSGSSGGPVPAFTVHAQHANKLTYERKLRSWRKSLTYETYPPLQPEGKKSGIASLWGPPYLGLPAVESHWRVSSVHAERCSCRRPRRCRPRHSRQPQHAYNRAAHWSGQTEAQLHLWTPEIYESLNCPLTVTREVDGAVIDDILNHEPSYGSSELRRYLHFDFDVEVRLREIGRGFWGMFKSSSKPPEIRARNDSGKPLPPDRSQLCVTCCAERISWPRHETRDLQSEAEEQIAKHGYVRRLQSTEEYQNMENQSATPSLGVPVVAMPQSHIQPPPPAYSQSSAGGGLSFDARGRPRAPISRSSSDILPNTQSSCRRVSFSPDYHLRTFGRCSMRRSLSIPSPGTGTIPGRSYPPPPAFPSPQDQQRGGRRRGGRKRGFQSAGRAVVQNEDDNEIVVEEAHEKKSRVPVVEKGISAEQIVLERRRSLTSSGSRRVVSWHRRESGYESNGCVSGGGEENR